MGVLRNLLRRPTTRGSTAPAERFVLDRQMESMRATWPSCEENASARVTSGEKYARGLRVAKLRVSLFQLNRCHQFLFRRSLERARLQEFTGEFWDQ